MIVQYTPGSRKILFYGSLVHTVQCYFLASTAIAKLERAELLCALFVDAHDYSVLDEDELLVLAVFFSRRSVLRSLPIFTSCRLQRCNPPCGSAVVPETCM